MTFLTDHLQSVRHVNEPAERVRLIKKAVADEVSGIDSRVEIKYTEYFNHSYVPDMVMHWPLDGVTRFLFVRANSDPSWLQDDLQVVGDTKPLLFTIDDFERSELQPATSVAAMAERAGAWVVDANGVGSLRTSVRSSTPTQLLAQGLLQGGRGFTPRPDLDALASIATGGFQAATELDQAGTGAAVDVLQTYLADEQSGRLTRLLRAVWEGHGGTSSLFPSTHSLGVLTDADFEYLLENLVDVPIEFWRQVGGALRLERIAHLDRVAHLPNFGLLVDALIDKLYAKGAQVAATHHDLFSDDDSYPQWSIRSGCLTFIDDEFSVSLAARRQEEFPKIGSQVLPTFKEARARVARGLSISSVEMVTAESRTVEYSSDRREDVLKDVNLTLLADAPATFVSRMTAVVDEQNATVDFARATVATPTNGTLPLDDLMRAASTAHSPATSSWPVRVRDYFDTRLALITAAGFREEPTLFEEDRP